VTPAALGAPEREAEPLDPRRAALLDVPALRAWPAAVDLIRRPVRASSLPCWEYPLLACAALGASREQAEPAAAAIFALIAAIHLVDDLLDDDPKGLFRSIGAGGAANLALAFQGAALEVLARAGLDADRQAALTGIAARITVDTAWGQHLDTLEIEGEEGYWRVVDHKTPPLFSGALAMGAVCAGASPEVAGGVGALGLEIGRMVQISDDLHDALERPAAPDWRRPSGCLPILYAMTVDHPDRARFAALLGAVEQPEALAEAQAVLFRSGAASYCVHRLLDQHRRAVDRLDALALPDPTALRALVDAYGATAHKLLGAAPGSA
jgi:geranylgeranyl pyrophosphate synthase